MFKTKKNSIIRDKVMEVLDEKITLAEKSFQVRCECLDLEFISDVENLRSRLWADKEKDLEKSIMLIVGRIA